MEETLINNKLLQELGEKLFPLEEIEGVPPKEIVFDLIELLYKYISKPKDRNNFDCMKGRYEYTIKINNLFENFKLSYELKSGKIKEKYSKTVDKIIMQDDFKIPDKEVQKFLNIAYEKFYSRNIQEKKIALEKLVDAYQRISSWECKPDKKGKDKDKSINLILNKISSQKLIVKDLLKVDFKEDINIANKYMIRHTEVDKKKIDDLELLEYLFYRYYIAIRLILRKYGYKT